MQAHKGKKNPRIQETKSPEIDKKSKVARDKTTFCFIERPRPWKDF